MKLSIREVGRKPIESEVSAVRYVKEESDEQLDAAKRLRWGWKIGHWV